MLPAQVVNVAEAGVGPLPNPPEFMRRLKLALDPEVADVGLFGTLFPAPSPNLP